MRKITSLILVCTIILSIFTGCSLLDKFGEDNSQSDELSPVSSVSMSEDEASSLKDKTPVQLYFINEQGNKLSPETRYINNSEANKGKEYLATSIVKELISGPAKGSLLKASIPKETTLHSNVTLKDGVATVDLSKEFIDKHPGGKKNEQLTLYSIVNSLTEIKEITSVKFKIDGKVRKDFKGNYQIDIAYPRTAYLINSQPIGENAANIESQDNKKKNTEIDGKGTENDTKKSDTEKNSSQKADNKSDGKKDEKTPSNQENKDQKTNADMESDEELLE